MDKVIHIGAIWGNLLLVGGIFVLLPEMRPNELQEYLLILLMFLVPLLSLWALKTGPDREERRLQTAVRKAELRKRLKELGSE